MKQVSPPPFIIRSLSGRCKENGKCWALDRKTFRYYCAISERKRKSMALDRLRRVPLLRDLTAEELADAAKATEVVEVQEGEVIIRKGDIDKDFYVILEGVVFCTDVNVACSVKSLERLNSGGAVKEKPVDQVAETTYKQGASSFGRRLRPGNHFGEIAIITGEPRSLNVVADSHARLLKFDEEAFQCVLGSLHDLLDKRANQRTCNATKFIVDLPSKEIRHAALENLKVRTFKMGSVISLDCGALPPLTDEGDALYEAETRISSGERRANAQTPLHFVIKSGTVVLKSQGNTMEEAEKAGEGDISEGATFLQDNGKSYRIHQFDFFRRKKHGDSFGRHFMLAAPPPSTGSMSEIQIEKDQKSQIHSEHPTNLPPAITALALDEVVCIEIDLDKVRESARRARHGVEASKVPQHSGKGGDSKDSDGTKSQTKGASDDNGGKSRGSSIKSAQQALDVDW